MEGTVTLKEHMLAVYQNRNRGKIPWAAYGGFLLPTGSIERQLRNRGCGWIQWAPVCSWQPPGMSHMNGWRLESKIKNVEMKVKTIWEGNEKVLHRIYDTPIGSVYEELREEPGYHSLWIKKFLINTPHDYEIIKFMVENTVFRDDYDTFLEAQDNLGDDGVELAIIDRSPFQKMLIELTGTEQLSFDLIDRLDLVEDLLSSIEKKQDEAFQIIADSPAEVIWMVDNLTADITEPKLFEKYCIPFYNKQAKLLHEKNKVLVVHFDGKLKNIKELIMKTDIDVIESFTLPEMGGDITIEDASEAWPDKAIVANIPAFLCYKEENEVRDYLNDLLEKVSPRKNFMLELSENFPLKYLKTILPIVADVMANQ
jgi:hypothetical protein